LRLQALSFLTMTKLIAYTDGGCRGNPGPGGWAFLLYEPVRGVALERCGGEAKTTNNRMELMATIEAMSAIRTPDHDVTIHTDSLYVLKSATLWIPGWKAAGWRKKGTELKNVDLLQRLDEQLARHRVTWKWVRGHAGDAGNERVDLLANQAMDRIAKGKAASWERRTTWPPSRAGQARGRNT
jgi:ribonuclease HI